MPRFASFALSLLVLSSVSPSHRLHAAVASDQWTTTDCSDTDHSNSSGQARACELRTAHLAPVGNQLKVTTENGGIQVIGEDRKDVSVEARVHAWAGSASEAKDIVRQVSIDASGGSIRNSGPHSFFGSKGYAVDYKLRVPRQLAVQLDSTNGGIEISRLNSEVRFETTNGGITLNDLAGDVRGETTNGGISIHLTGDRWNGKGLSAETTNGGVQLFIPENYSAHLETGTVNGGFEFNFPITFSGDIKKHLSLDLGHGGPTIHAETTNGGVSVSRNSAM